MSGSNSPNATSKPVLAKTLRSRRDMRAGLVHGAYAVGGIVLGLVLPGIEAGPQVSRSAVGPLVLGIAGGFISFIALVFSLLFLVVQFGNTTISPRLTLFRDDPMVWHSFGFFIAVFVYTTTAAIRMGAETDDVSVLVPVTAVTLTIVAMSLSRTLQLRALRLLQVNSTMEEVRRRGEEVITSIFSEPFTSAPPEQPELPPFASPLVWDRPSGMLRQIDLPHLLEEASRLDAVVELHLLVGQEARRGQEYATVYAHRPVTDETIAAAMRTGVDRIFRQDPLLAFRLLSDIGNRALSSAINDPATAVQAFGCIYDLLAVVAGRQLGSRVFLDKAGHARVLVHFPEWEDFLAAGVDEVAEHGKRAPIVNARLQSLLADLYALAPAERRPPIEMRIARYSTS